MRGARGDASARRSPLRPPRARVDADARAATTSASAAATARPTPRRSPRRSGSRPSARPSSPPAQARRDVRVRARSSRTSATTSPIFKEPDDVNLVLSRGDAGVDSVPEHDASRRSRSSGTRCRARRSWSSPAARRRDAFIVAFYRLPGDRYRIALVVRAEGREGPDRARLQQLRPQASSPGARAGIAAASRATSPTATTTASSSRRSGRDELIARRSSR